MKIVGKQHYLWRAVDQDGEVVDVYLQKRRDGAAAKRFFKRLALQENSWIKIALYFRTKVSLSVFKG
jgi:putative transposase